MQLEQIIIRPRENNWIIQYSDEVGRSNNLVVDTNGNTAVSALIADAQGRLPAPQNHPAKDEVQQEIAELEYRLKQLKKSIGVN